MSYSIAQSHAQLDEMSITQEHKTVGSTHISSVTELSMLRTTRQIKCATC